MPDIERALDLLEEVRNFLNEAPITELEAVEAALGRNAPIHQIAEAIQEVWLLSAGYSHRELATNPKLNLVLENNPSWYWFTMPNGDLVLGAYPQGDICERIINET